MPEPSPSTSEAKNAPLWNVGRARSQGNSKLPSNQCIRLCQVLAAVPAAAIGNSAGARSVTENTAAAQSLSIPHLPSHSSTDILVSSVSDGQKAQSTSHKDYIATAFLFSFCTDKSTPAA